MQCESPGQRPGSLGSTETTLPTRPILDLIGSRAPALGPDRRIHPRHLAVVDRVRLNWIDGVHPHDVPARMIDISRGGSLIVSEAAPPEGKVINLRLANRDDLPMLRAIVHSSTQPLTGLFLVRLRFETRCPDTIFEAAVRWQGQSSAPSELGPASRRGPENREDRIEHLVRGERRKRWDEALALASRDRVMERSTEARGIPIELLLCRFESLEWETDRLRRQLNQTGRNIRAMQWLGIASALMVTIALAFRWV